MGGVFQQLLEISVMASYLIVAVLISRMLFKKGTANFRCVLWLLVGVRLLIPVQITSPFSLVPEVQVPEVVMSAQTVSGAIGSELGVDAGNNTLQQGMEHSEIKNDISENLRADSLSTESMGAESLSSESLSVENQGPENRGAVTAETIAAMIWLTGTCAMLCYMLFSWMRLKRSLKTAVPRMITCSGKQVKVYCADGITSPFLLGLLQPKIYMPHKIQEENLEYIIAHEQMHIRRRDYLTKPLSFLVLAVYWFNPLVWVAYIMFGKDIERACDEQVLRDEEGMDKAAYAGALLSCASGRRKMEVCPVAFGESDVKKRVRNVLRYKRPGVWILSASSVFCIALVMCFMTVRGAEVSGENRADGSVQAENAEAEQSENAVMNAKSGRAESEIEVESEENAVSEDAGLLTMEMLLEWKTTGELKTMAEEQGLEAFLAYDNVYKEETENLVKEVYYCDLEYEGKDYQMKLNYLLPGKSVPGMIYSIYVYYPESEMGASLYYATTGYKVNSQLPTLYLAYGFDHFISCELPDGYKLSEFREDLDFAGCLLEGEETTEFADVYTRPGDRYVPENRYALGGLGIVSNNLRYGELVFEDGKVSDVTWEEKYMTKLAPAEAVDGCVYSAILTEYKFNLFDANSWLSYSKKNPDAKISEVGVETYWYVFICDEDSEIGYVVYLNQDYFSKEETIEFARSITLKEEM